VPGRRISEARSSEVGAKLAGEIAGVHAKAIDDKAGSIWLNPR
jgi:hypothetical protein